MTGWAVVLVACGVCYALKLAGHLVPARLLARPVAAAMAALITVALLSALCAAQTFARGDDLVPDARLVAVVVAGALLWRRAPFIVVVVAAALVAASLRAVG